MQCFESKQQTQNRIRKAGKLCVSYLCACLKLRNRESVSTELIYVLRSQTWFANRLSNELTDYHRAARAYRMSAVHKNRRYIAVKISILSIRERIISAIGCIIKAIILLFEPESARVCLSYFHGSLFRAKTMFLLMQLQRAASIAMGMLRITYDCRITITYNNLNSSLIHLPSTTSQPDVPLNTPLQAPGQESYRESHNWPSHVSQHRS